MEVSALRTTREEHLLIYEEDSDKTYEDEEPD
jgi:hypothetical protein